MTDADIVKTYSDEALQGIVNSLSKSGQWYERLEVASLELSRRKANLRR